MEGGRWRGGVREALGREEGGWGVSRSQARGVNGGQGKRVTSGQGTAGSASAAAGLLGKSLGSGTVPGEPLARGPLLGPVILPFHLVGVN